MGKRGSKRGGRGGRGQGRANVWRERTGPAEINRQNELLERYYNDLKLVEEEEMNDLWAAMRRDLPNSFRFTGSKGHALAVQRRLKEFYIPHITSITHNDEAVEPPKPVPWYPDELAWFMTTPKNIIRRFPPFASFQKFLVAETDVGNISRQEVVSMIPPLCMDLKPGMTVLDLCAAPGSKSAQLLEMLHGGEEERSRTVAHNLANGLDRPTGEGYEDDGRSTGLLVANDVDSRRAHMLVHQMKRLSSANIIVTNHDATIFPSIKLPPQPAEDGQNLANKYLKFDRILADVPCTGDGTCRKNIEIWSKWNPASALGLHPTQVKILVRALQMLKVGGRVVYSTCSMNPVEDEAVLAAAISQCGGPEKVELQDSSEYLPELRRKPGLTDWKIMDKQGRIWSSYEEVLRHREAHGEDNTARLLESMFPSPEANLDRAMRIYPHLQDTGAFFVAILEKKSEIKVRSGAKTQKVVSEVPANETLVEHTNGSEVPENAPKRQPDDVEDSSNKRIKIDQVLIPQLDGSTEDAKQEDLNTPPVREKVAPEIKPDAAPKKTVIQSEGYKMKKSGQTIEEPFKYLNPDAAVLNSIWQFYEISPQFPRDRFMVRNATGTANKNIYYTSSLAKTVLQENESKGMKFVHCGIKMFVKQDVPSPEVCPWRIQNDGLAVLEAWVSPKRRVKLWSRQTLRKLLIEMFPQFTEDGGRYLGEITDQIKDMGMGCCVLEVEPREGEDGLQERMVFPLWRSLTSVNLMLAKEDRKALLLRLFNDETPLVNLSQRKAQKSASKDDDSEMKTEDTKQEKGEKDGKDEPQRRNSSSAASE